MATTGDRDMAPTHERGSVEFEMRCRLCDTDLGQDWPDLSKLDPLHIKNHALDEWRRAADWGCSFCNLVVSVLDDSWKQYGCYDSRYYKDPETARNPVMQGFQVLLHHNGNGRYLLALEHVMLPLVVDPPYDFRGTITIYLDEPDIFNLNLEPFFQIPSHSGSPHVLKLARHWLSTCRNCHPGCSAGQDRYKYSSGIPNAAIRMIEIKGGVPRLVQLELCEVMPPYMALSHCWGSSNKTLKTLSTNIQRFQSEIHLSSLPMTFKHAMEVASSLGFEYIWIDSLCIIQDSAPDWEKQSSLMAFIYSNADLVLAASTATSTEDGFLKERKTYRESLLEVEGVRDRTHIIRLKYRLLQPKDMPPMRDPLDRRAWALQERMLARRYLAFGSHEISWTCIASSACECEWWRVATTWRTEIRSIERDLRETMDEELGDCWRVKVLGQYFDRRLSHQSDKLFAISAIASIFDFRMRSGYLAGLWRIDLPVGLLWQNPRPMLGYIEHRRNIPSWTWASLPLYGFITPLRTNRHGESLVNVLEARTKPSTVNQFGSVNGGFIKLWGELWKTDLIARNLQQVLHVQGKTYARYLGTGLSFRVRGCLKERIFLDLDTSLIKTRIILPNGESEGSVRRIRLDEVQERHYIAGFLRDEVVHLFMIPLFRQYDFGYGETMIYGLLVARSSRRPKFFERIGTFFFPDSDDNKPWAPTSTDHDAENEAQEMIMI